MLAKKICGIFLLGMALASSKIIHQSQLKTQIDPKSFTDSLALPISQEHIQKNSESHQNNAHQENEIVLRPENYQPKVKQLFEPFELDEHKKAKESKQMNDNKNTRDKRQKESSQKKKQSKSGNKIKKAGSQPRERNEQKIKITEGKYQIEQVKNDSSKREGKQHSPSKKFDILRVQTKVITKKVPNKKATISVKAPSLPKFLAEQKQKKQVSWMIHDEEEQKPQKDGAKKYTRFSDVENNQIDPEVKDASKITPISSANQGEKLEKTDISTKFLYQIGFESAQVKQCLVFHKSIDQFNAPIQICSGSALSNRLTSQFTILRESGVPFIWRQLKLKPGPYKIRFDWQADEPGGQLEVFWNHRLVGSFKSFQNHARKEIVNVQASKCDESQNTLKFMVAGPIPVGIDNIQVIS